MKNMHIFLKFCWAVVLSVCILSSCGEKGMYVIKGGKHINRTDTIGLESIAVRIDTLTFRTDSLYDIRLFGISEDRLFGMTADNIIVVLDKDGHVVSANRRIGRGPGEFASMCSIRYNPYNNVIQILDTFNKLILLDSDGEFKNEIKNDEVSASGDIVPLGKDRYAATGISRNTRDYAITILDKDFNPVGRLMPIMDGAQRPTVAFTVFESMRVYNGKVMYKPFGEYTYYVLSDSTYVPYLRTDFGRYTESVDMQVMVDDAAKANKFQIGYECICGKYYLVQILYQKDLCWFYDIYDITTGKRVSHCRYGLAEYESGVDEGFILRFDGQEYRIVPDYVEDNVLYWSRFNEDNTTTLFTIHL